MLISLPFFLLSISISLLNFVLYTSPLHQILSQKSSTMGPSIPTVTTTEILKETTDILQESIKASNRLSQVMEYQAESLSLPQEQSSNIQDAVKGKEPTHGHGPSSSTTAIVPGMSEFEKSIAAQNLKERAESDHFIRNFAAKQQGEKLLSVTDPWFGESVG